MNAAFTSTICLAASLVAGSAVAAQDAASVARAFADNCFNPRLTAVTAQEKLRPSGARIDFYDLDPFTSAAPSPLTGRAQTQGTDRRCETAFNGFDPQIAMHWVQTGLVQEGLADKVTDIPDAFPLMEGNIFAAAAQLNPNRIAIVQVGIRETAQGGQETYMNLERLTPLDEATQ